MAGTRAIEAARADASAGRTRTLGGPAAWTAPALASSGEWLVRFDDAQRDELRAAARRLARDDRPPASIVRDDVPLPASAALLDDARTAYEDAAGARPRHLLRVWLSMRESRALDPAARASFHDCRAGAVRGGYSVAPRLAFAGDP